MRCTWRMLGVAFGLSVAGCQGDASPPARAPSIPPAVVAARSCAIPANSKCQDWPGAPPADVAAECAAQGGIVQSGPCDTGASVGACIRIIPMPQQSHTVHEHYLTTGMRPWSEAELRAECEPSSGTLAVR